MGLQDAQCHSSRCSLSELRLAHPNLCPAMLIPAQLLEYSSSSLHIRNARSPRNKALTVPC